MPKNILEHNYNFDMLKNQISEDAPIIKVIGVGGAGGNAVAHMHRRGIQNVEFVVCNTDRQSLMKSPIETKLQLGAERLKGLGAGTDASEGASAAEESIEYIKDLMQQPTQMVFITAGMGGGTGTGASPVIAKAAKEAGMLTVAVVTAPRHGEGRLKKRQAIDGINQLKQHCDTVLVILNDQLAKLHGKLPRSEADEYADNVLTNAVKGIAEIITVTGKANADFMDVKRVLENAGTSVMASATARGDNRAALAIKEALNSPLLNNKNIRGAKRILITLTSAHGKHESTYDEETIINEFLENEIGDETDLTKIGVVYDESMGEDLQLTIIAAGFDDSYLPFTMEGTYGEKKSEIVQTPQPPKVEPNPVVLVEPASNQHITMEDEIELELELTASAPPIKVIFGQQPEIQPSKKPKIDSKVEEYKEKPELLQQIRQSVENKIYSETDFNQPAYLRQGVVFFEKPAIPKNDFVRIYLDKSKR